ncbi:MAG: succinate dehydrogenase, cytochrome b556 subunit [Gammaproteobacteria bacterium]|nr:succinate dehydrogenase, cytochrome b556 subunit [Gammaproteobacteria bacterium]
MSDSDKPLNIRDMSSNRPVYLSLVSFKFPVMAIASIIHRVSGVFLAAGLVPAILMWHTSLQSEGGFALVQTWFNLLAVQLLVWFYLSCLFYHALAGIKHLFMDLGWGESQSVASKLSWGIICIAILFSAGLLYLMVAP